MPINEIMIILMFGFLCFALIGGFPVAFTLAGIGLIFAGIGIAIDIFDPSYLLAIPQRIYGRSMTNYVLIAVPLFVFMGAMLQQSKVAEDLLESMGLLFGKLRGGLGISVSIVGALMAASTGIVGATVVTMGLLSLPTMLKRGYDPSLACGSIAAAGTLGQIIPPSIVLVLLGDVLSSAYQKAQLEQGNFSPDTVSVSDLFAGALIPGLVLVGMYIVYQAIVAWLKPETSPSVITDETKLLDKKALRAKILNSLIPPIFLIIAVLGSILGGVATPTEAAAVGAIGALLLGGLRIKQMKIEESNKTSNTLLGKLVFGLVENFRRFDNNTKKPISVYAAGIGLLSILIIQSVFDLRVAREFIPTSDMFGIFLAGFSCVLISWGIIVSLSYANRSGILKKVNITTMEISAMVFVILIGASIFSLVFRGFGGDDYVHEILSDVPGGKFGAIFVAMLIMFLLGFFLDFIEITFVVVPIVAPVLLMMDISPVWLGVMMAVNLQTSFLTPPFGFALFYLRGVAPNQIKTMHIYKGVLPFVGIQIIALLILSLFPGLATWLPDLLFD